MHPIFLQFGSFAIHWYGVCAATGFLLYFYLLRHLNRVDGQRRSDSTIANLVTLLVVGALAGARTAYVLEHWSHYRTDLGSIVKFTEGGLVFYGGLIMDAALLTAYALARRERVLALLDLLVTPMPIAHALGRIGCFMEGCCHGAVTTSALGVTYPPGSHAQVLQAQQGLVRAWERSLPVWPSQLFEAGAEALIFAVLFLSFRHRRFTGQQVALYGLLYAPTRFVLEYFRSDIRMTVGPFTIAQVISLALFAACAAVAVWKRPRKA